MRTMSFLIAFAVVLIGPSLAGTPDGDLPGIGTFSYGAQALVSPGPSLAMAAR